MTTAQGPTAPDGGPNRRVPERDRLLTELGGQVRDLATKLAKHRDTLVDLASTVSEFGPQLVDVQRDLGKLSEQVEELLESPEIKNPPIDWATLTAEDAEREWVALANWVDAVLPRYYEITRDQLPDCWALHWPAVVQLSWLRTSRIESYLKRSHPNQAAEWNTRWLDATLDKIKQAIPDTRCRPRAGRPGEHLVSALEATQRRADPQDLRDRAQQLHQRVVQPAYAQQPQYGQHPARPYSDPAYTQPGPAPQQPPPQPAPQPGGHSTSGDVQPGEEVIRRDYWREYFDQARHADVAWRREREAEQAAADTAQHRDDRTS